MKALVLAARDAITLLRPARIGENGIAKIEVSADREREPAALEGVENHGVGKPESSVFGDFPSIRPVDFLSKKWFLRISVAEIEYK